MSWPQHPVRRRGLTLVELIAAMTIVATLGSVISVVLSTAIGGYTRAATTAQLNSEIGVALDRIDQLLRFIPQNSVGGPDITSITPTSLTWSANWSISLSGGELLLAEAGGTASTLLKDVSAFTIAADDQSNAPLAANLSGSACNAVQRLRVSVTLTRSGISETLRTRIFVRSLMIGVEG